MYPKFVAPFDYIPFETMSIKEADSFFQWFLEIQHNRIQILIDFFEDADGSRIQ